MHLKIGSYLQGGKYRIVRFIKSGGFGCTYEALHTVFGNRFAIKEFFPKDFCNRDADTHHVTVGTQSKKALVSKLKSKFIDEAVAIHNLSHPGIVKVSDVFEENGTAYYVMDYIDGCSLDDLVKREGTLSEQNALGYIRQVCEALSYVHSQKRLHLDIKPGNIMLDGCGRAILIDFGTSRQYDEVNGENTSTLLPLTPGYAPTEQYRRDGMAQFTPVTDVYSLGATLYKLLTGVTPVDAPSRASGESLAPLPSCVSQSVSSAVQAAMSLDMAMRPQSVEEFMSLLEQPEVPVEGDDTVVIGSDKEEVVGPDDFHVDPVPDADKRNLKKWLWPLLAGLSVVAVVLLAVSRPFEPDDLSSDLSSDLSVYKEFLHLGDSLSMHEESLSEAISAYDSASFYEQKYSGSRYSRRFRGTASSKSDSAYERLKRSSSYNNGVLKVGSVEYPMVYVSGGSFEMGATSEQTANNPDSDEYPVHRVTLSGYSIGKYEVTQELWEAVMGSNPSYFKGARKPVELVSWDNCQEFIRKLNDLTDANFRLPTEAEWEFAARGGNSSRGYIYSGSDSIGNVAWYEDNSGSQTHDVGLKSPNELGLYDMSGNVYEWCSDWYGSYSSSSQTNPKGPGSGSSRVHRGGNCGGGWYNLAGDCRVSHRSRTSPHLRLINLGLRLCH